MVQTPKKTLTLEEFLKLPETEPASEYFEGQIIQKPMPQGKHSTLQGELAPTINQAVRSQKIAWAFPELRCTFGGKSIVPDVAVFTWSRIPLDEQGAIANIFNAAPDWTIEILSPEQSETKPTQKILHSLKHGCQMGWLIDPDELSVVAYPAKQEPIFFDLEAPNELLPVPSFASNLQLTVGTLFSWLQVN
jgi:Uma2 family endonuclease